jgi:anti-sigma factor RsiW
MVECVTYRPMIGSREGELTAAEASALTAHVAGCDGCRRWAADLAATEGIVSEALLAAAAARDFGPFVDQVMARVEARRPVPFLERLKRAVRLHPRLVIGGALAPLVAAVVVAVYLGAGGGRDVADNRGLELTTEGSATTVIQSSDGPVLLLDDDDDDQAT